LDTQFFVVWGAFFLVCAVAGLSPLFGFAILEAIVLAAVAAGTAYIVDVLTVRLVPAGKWRGILGYEV
jgi:hypothetical protein